ncbi:hypothetical protein J8C02_05335 [Chloracidobacterium sp. MS 40/45]|uniref:hypothetical protein n=1 Tax=Chloracidobacterium aggregatum TaxID=2851959 RepID=UPI001B8AAA79|nr:hypothetical protein [Chloracidobacterium aggregatum]QUW00910.1 hypothetical protein J8C02_05335 [Chloracidobacterium sp. MS 40/45]
MKPKSAIILAAALALLAGLLPSLSCQNGSAAGDANPGAAAMSPEFAARLGQDDGFALSVLFGSDVQGNLKDCGCPKHPQGGIAWRMGYAEGLKKLAPDAAIVQLDAGRMFANSVGYIQPYDRVRNEWMLRAYGEAGFAAANASYFDVQMLAELLHKPEFDTKRQTFPFLNRIVSANIRPTKPELTPLPAYVIETVESKRLPKPVRLGITGVTMANPNPGAETLNFAIEDPAEALKRVLPELRTKADFVIVMSYGPDIQTDRITKVPGIDLVVVANNSGAMYLQVQKVNDVSVVYAFSQTKLLGDLRLYYGSDGQISQMRLSMPSLDKDIPKDQRWEQMVADAQKAIDEAMKAVVNSPPAEPAGPPSSAAPAGK